MNIEIFKILEYWFKRPIQYSNIQNIRILEILEYYLQDPSQYSNIYNIEILEIFEYCFQRSSQYLNISIFQYCNRVHSNIGSNVPIFEYFKPPDGQPFNQYSNISNIEILEIFEYWLQRGSQYSNILNIVMLEIFKYSEYYNIGSNLPTNIPIL